ncbi:MAG: hypothetical protein HY894_04825 [Deltaproteobacteria bacterium]|nr:hypothetical protein [Deltaproteobacteria bacterium]
MQRTRYRTGNISGSGDTVRVLVKISLPVVYSYEDLLTAPLAACLASQWELKRATLLADAFAQANMREYGVNFEQNNRLKNLQTVMDEISLDLIQEEGHWRVYIDLEGRAKRQGEGEGFMDEMVDAAARRKAGEDARAAQEKYLEIKRLDERQKEGNAVAPAHAVDKRAYMSKVEISGAQVARTPDGSVLYGDLVNRGDVALTDVEITIHGLDIRSRAIFEITYHPLIDPASPSGKVGGMKRGYLMPGQTTPISYTFPSMPPGCNGAVDVKVTDIRY